MTDVRMLPVPDGLDGLRLDVALSRLFGLSRSAAAGLIDDGAVTLDGGSPARSERVRGGSWLEVSIPEPVDLAAAPPRAVDGLAVLHSDDDLVVIDKPVGVAAHPTIGWDGPDGHPGPGGDGHPAVHLGRGRAAGHRAPAGRRHHRGDGGGPQRAGLHRAQAGVQGAHRGEAVRRPGAGPPRSRAAARWTRRSTGTRPRTGSSRWWPAGVPASPTTRRCRPTGPPRCSTSGWRPGAPTRSGCTWPPCATPAAATPSTAPIRC